MGTKREAKPLLFRNPPSTLNGRYPKRGFEGTKPFEAKTGSLRGTKSLLIRIFPLPLDKGKGIKGIGLKQNDKKSYISPGRWLGL